MATIETANVEQNLLEGTGTCRGYQLHLAPGASIRSGVE
jgi:hypothetical protein